MEHRDLMGPSGSVVQPTRESPRTFATSFSQSDPHGLQTSMVGPMGLGRSLATYEPPQDGPYLVPLPRRQESCTSPHRIGYGRRIRHGRTAIHWKAVVGKDR